MSLLTRAIDTILPPRCPVSGDIVTAHGMVAPHIWADFDFIAAPFCKVCGIPFDYDIEGDPTCSDCLENPPPYTSSRAALRYNENSRDIVLGFKHADKMHAVKIFTPWLKTAGADVLNKADALIPVPLHPWRLIKRRYNQAALIADDLGKATDIPVIKNALIRHKATRSQGHLHREERADNVKDAFIIKEKHKPLITGKTLILIDDVYTSGATAKECTKHLLENGAASVHILTIARVGRSDPLM